MKRTTIISIVGVIVLFGIIVVQGFPEGFVDIDPKTIELLMKTKDTKAPNLDPAVIMKNLRGLLDRYDNPDLWNHAKKVHTMSPGELARMNLGV
jgi:hypothetical protein